MFLATAVSRSDDPVTLLDADSAILVLNLKPKSNYNMGCGYCATVVAGCKRKKNNYV